MPQLAALSRDWAMCHWLSMPRRRRLLLARREPGEVELLGEQHAELVGLRPAHGADHRADADDVDRQDRARARSACRIRPARPSPTCCAGGFRSAAPSIAAIARRIRRWRGSRTQLKPSASTVTALAMARATSAVGRLAEDIALDLADPEFADQLQIVVGLDALGGGVHAEAVGEGDDGADDRAVAVGRRRPRRGRSSGRS